MHQGMQRAASTVLIAGLAAAELANYGGVPFIGPLSLLLGELGRTCEQIKFCKQKIKHLLNRCKLILDVFQERSQDTELQQAADAFTKVLSDTHERMSQYAGWGLFQSLWKREEISNEITRSLADIESYQDRFQLTANMVVVDKVTKIQETVQHGHDEILELLRGIMASPEEIANLVKTSQEGESAPAREIMKVAQTELHAQSKGSVCYTEFKEYVRKIYETTGVMPVIPYLNPEVVRFNEPPLAGGTYSEISKGLWLDQYEVAVKSLREVKVSDTRARRRFEREISVWYALEHVNILRFLGVTDNSHAHICLISPWQSNGNVLDYTQTHPAVNRLQLLVTAARGIEYLHSRTDPIIHGNIKCSNILVSEKGEALITDFGLSAVMKDITDPSVFSSFTSSGSETRWFAPELMHDNNSPSFQTDVYAFSMSILECLTSEKPFSHIHRDPQVVFYVMSKQTPRRPKDEVWDNWFSEPLWRLLEQSWAHEADSRPPISLVLSQLENLSGSG